MSLLIASDLHAHNWSRFSTTLPDGTNSRFQDLLNVIDQIEAYAEEYDVLGIAILGDLTHRRYYMQFSIYTPLMKRLYDLNQKTNHGLVVLVGNHDIESRGHHSLGPLSYAGITVVDEPKWINMVGFGWAFFCPYMDGERVAQACREQRDKVSPGDVRTAFLHYNFDGKVMGGGEYAVPSALRPDDLDWADKIFFGHVHAPSVENDARVIYVGAPMHFDFGDTGDRYCWYIPTPGAAPLALPLKAPRFVTTSYPRIPVPPLEMSGFIRVLNTPANLFADVKKAALDVGWLDCVCVEQSMPHEAIRVLSSAVFADEQIIRAYVARAYPNLTDAEREPVVAFGLSCLREPPA